ncbi:hypothetical protein [Thalassomonas sp. RHCl1]|uniref:hypothetical protein n=1 Tax=Thalassomonas sp. RHCl1 TaxID=2995320 RepID=UPI00248D0C4E|nr:hypothetical protein [Thalassomonas sp. RHCl1]
MKVKSVFLLVLCLIAGFLWLSEPYMQRQYVRISNSPITIEAEYFTVTGDPLCTKFYRVMDGKITDTGIFPNMPTDIPDPHAVAAFKDGDRVELTGFLYQWQETNLVTGTTRSRPVNMIDVLTWQASTGIHYQSKQTNTQAGAFKQVNYTNCKP